MLERFDVRTKNHKTTMGDEENTSEWDDLETPSTPQRSRSQELTSIRVINIGKSLAKVDMKTELHLTKDIVVEQVTMDQAHEGGLCVGFWRHDFDLQSRDVSRRNLRDLLDESTKAGHQYMALDVVTVDTENDSWICDALLRKYPLVTSFARDAFGAMRDLRRPWFQHDLRQLDTRTSLGQICPHLYDYSEGPWGFVTVTQTLQYCFGTEPSLLVVKKGSYILVLVISALLILVLLLPLVVVFGFRFAVFSLKWGKEMAVMDLKRQIPTFGLSFMSIGFWLTLNGRSVVEANLSKPPDFSSLQSEFRMLHLLLFACLYVKVPVLYFGDCLHILASGWENKFVVNLRGEGKFLREEDKGDIAKVRSRFVYFSKGNGLGLGLHNCNDCRLRCVVILIVVRSAIFVPGAFSDTISFPGMSAFKLHETGAFDFSVESWLQKKDMKLDQLGIQNVELKIDPSTQEIKMTILPEGDGSVLKEDLAERYVKIIKESVNSMRTCACHPKRTAIV